LALAAVTATIMARELPGFFSSRERAAIGVVAFSVVGLEIVAILVAGKATESSEQSR
jgi:hypothetical protein